MNGFEARLERLELKYLIDERTADDVRREIEPFCQPDRHSARARRDGATGYAISSLYLDSPGLAFHQAKQRGDPDRLKLRARSYGPGSPVVLEVKQRSADVIDKRRVRVSPDEVERVVEGFPPLAADGAAGVRQAGAFAGLVTVHGAEPTLLIRYRREAYVGEVDDYARVTMDREIEAQRVASFGFEGDPAGWTAFDDHWDFEHRNRSVVLELKCHNTVPYWITELIRRNGLARTSFSKYSIGIDLTSRAMGFDGLLRRSARVMR